MAALRRSSRSAGISRACSLSSAGDSFGPGHPRVRVWHSGQLLRCPAKCSTRNVLLNRNCRSPSKRSHLLRRSLFPKPRPVKELTSFIEMIWIASSTKNAATNTLAILTRSVPTPALPWRNRS